MQMKRLFRISLFLLPLLLSAQNERITIVDYNLMWYRAGSAPCTHSQTPTQRDSHLKDILSYTSPDIFVVNELGANPSNSTFLKDFVLNANGSTRYNVANYSNNGFSSLTNMLFYDSTKLGLFNQDFIDKEIGGNSIVRGIDVYRLFYKDPKFNNGADTVFFTIISAHLKAGNTNPDALERADATEALMAYLENTLQDDNVIFCGDFNVYANSEPAFQNLVNHTDATENFFDPINQSGNWNNNSNYASVHTQSTRSSSSGCFSGGGLDDRFDFFLISEEIKDGTQKVEFVPNSYQAIGQDGNHFNQSVNNGTNNSVPSSVADALYNFSDHLPILMQLDITKSNIGLAENFVLDDQLNYNNPISDKLNLSFKSALTENIQIELINLTGKTILHNTMIAGEQHSILNTNGIANGIYLLSIKAENGNSLVKKIIKR